MHLISIEFCLEYVYFPDSFKGVSGAHLINGTWDFTGQLKARLLSNTDIEGVLPKTKGRKRKTQGQGVERPPEKINIHNNRF